MATASIVWHEGGTLNVADLSYESEMTLGRASGMTVRLADQTVSREHAAVRFDGARFVIENRSRTNPARLAGVAIAEPTPLPDGASIRLGGIELEFHNLAAGDRLSGPVCSHCGRENDSSEKDCWYCGTSLVSAATTIRQRLQVICRVISAGGERWDLHPGRAMLLRGDGSVALIDADDAPEPGALKIGLDGMRLLAAANAADDSISVAGETPTGAGRELATGDRIDVGPARFWVLVR